MKADTGNWIGVLLSGRYQINRQIGAGGMAFVYLAEDRRDSRSVVIKVPRQGVLDDPEFAGRFNREMKSLLRLTHPNIVKILGTGEHDGRPFMILDYLSGGNLRDRLTRGPCSAADLQSWLKEIASALDFCHLNKCVHRDVKPDNILFDAQGRPSLSDFGIAKVFHTKTRLTVLTSADMFLGTAQYMAPELILDEKYDGRVDQYALAVTVYEALSGRVPFKGTNPSAILLQQNSTAPTLLSSFVPTLPKELASTVQKALDLDPSKRFENCQAFASSAMTATSRGPAAGILEPQSSAPSSASRAAVVCCPACKKKIGVGANALGKRVLCPSCRKPFVVPPAEHLSDSEAGKTTKSHRQTEPTKSERRLPTPSTSHTAYEQPLGQPVRTGKIKRILFLSALVCFFFIGMALATWLWLGREGPVQQDLVIRQVPDISMRAGTKAMVNIAVDRNNYSGPIKLTLSGLPAHVSVLSANPAVLFDGESIGQFEIHAAADAASVEKDRATIIADANGRRVEKAVLLTIERSSGELFLAPFKEIVLEAGKKATLDVRIVRRGVEGPVTVSLKGLSATIKTNPEPIILGAGVNDKQVELEAAADIDVSTTLKVQAVAESNGVQDTQMVVIRLEKTKTNLPTVALRLLPISRVDLQCGETKTIDVAVDRTGVNGPIELKLEAKDLLGGKLVIKSDGIAPGSNVGKVTIKAGTDALPPPTIEEPNARTVEFKATVVAVATTNGPTKIMASESVLIKLINNETLVSFRIKPVAHVALLPGEDNQQVIVDVESSGFKEVFTLKVKGLPDRVKVHNPVFRPDMDSTKGPTRQLRLTFSVEPDAPPSENVMMEVFAEAERGGKQHILAKNTFAISIAKTAAFNPYRAIDRHARETPKEKEDSLASLALHLVEPAKNEREKARAIFMWVTDRVKFDEALFVDGKPNLAQYYAKNPDVSSTGVLKSKKTVCEGYARLFADLCSTAGLKAEIIRGDFFTLGVGGPHTWNAVQIDGKWELIDTTAGAGGWRTDAGFKYVCDDFYFFPRPELLALSHFPYYSIDKQDPVYEKQFLPSSIRSITKQEFDNWRFSGGDYPQLFLRQMLHTSDQSLELLARMRKQKSGGVVNARLNQGKKIIIHEAPLDRSVKVGSKLRIRIESPDCASISIAAKNGFPNYLKNKGTTFEGEFTVQIGSAGFVLIAAAFRGAPEYYPLLQYDIE